MVGDVNEGVAMGQERPQVSDTRPFVLRPRPTRATFASRQRGAGVTWVMTDRDIGGQHFGRTYWVYVMANEPRGVLYVGMTSDVAKPRAQASPGHAGGLHETLSS